MTKQETKISNIFNKLETKINDIQSKVSKVKFKDIIRFTQRPSYHVNIPLDYIEDWINNHTEKLELQLNPDFQRGHVWTQEQQIAYIEYLLRGGSSGRDFYFNRIGGMYFSKLIKLKTDFVCVDGLQRITAVLAFIHNEIPAFEYYARDYDNLRMADVMFDIYVNDLKEKKDVLKWYLEMNSGGTPHTTEELNKVRKMISEI